MPFTKPNLEYQQLGLGEAFDALVDAECVDPAEAARISDVARAALLHMIKTGSAPKIKLATEKDSEQEVLPQWLDPFLNLLTKGWPWRQAAYIAWMASPINSRWPATQEELATKVLGLSSDRVISTWRKKNPSIDRMVGTVQTAELFRWRGDMFAALIQSALTPSYRNHNDRKLMAEMTGDFVPITQLKAMMLKGDFKTNRDTEDLSDEELLQLAGGDFAPLMRKDTDAGPADEPSA
ncbi:MAG: hypothetical protein KF821_09075 [Anaerolineales bacterium]|nr:hypothetical protein [Anaerolineales bacterium]